ncbi:Hypothetical protein R9X50_00301100 [Acrodontium crateriforme]|uniref:NYN domain-containing protein n=1 Tax=Acrodontium crateriforme TaxID=150365 RepID=A0AAQ3M4Z6_9PEZI|nr:Hypothetical protein R9X50_00301100 [Acrodontium crateriforme]
MSNRTQSQLWDLAHVVELGNSLSSSDSPRTISPEGDNAATSTTSSRGISTTLSNIARKDFALNTENAAPAKPAGLGDFAKLWQFLGTPLDSPVLETPDSPGFPSKEDYASDGATFFKAPQRKEKGVQWLDNTSGEEQVTDTITDRSASPDSPTLTKTQRKKRNRKLRKAEQAARMARMATVSESEADLPIRRTPTPASRASAHMRTTESPSRLSRRDRLNVRESENQRNHITMQSLEADMELARNKVAETMAELNPNISGSKKHLAHHSTPRVNKLAANMKLNSYSEKKPAPAKDWPMSDSNTTIKSPLLPASVKPKKVSAAAALNERLTAQNPNGSAKSRNLIEPKIVRSGEDKDWALLMKLINNFWEDRKHLISPMNLMNHNNNPNGIHVFVDASNIFIGFTDQLKRSRGISPGVHVPQAGLSFDALALLMERRRPVAKRVLAGSLPHLPAFDKAKAVGYECSILEKVYKARELTERQIFFKDQERGNASSSSAKALANGIGSSGSGSETTTPQYAPARMIEQGVDEILHLKILESVVDYDKPSTIVLATGDAAQAEYSQGFMAMVERALKKGWKVELVSWSANISMMYRKKEWAKAWGEQFKVIFLDDYAEELLDM